MDHDDAPRTARGPWWITLALLAVVQSVLVIDSTAMNVSLATVATDLDVTMVQMQLAVALFTLVMAASMLPCGRIGDLLGRRRALLLGMAIYAIGSLATSLAPNYATLLLGWCLLEGIGAALSIPALQALVAGTYQGARRATAYGVVAGAGGAAAAIGPLAGGWLTSAVSWRVIFAVEFGLLVLVAPLLVRQLPAMRPRPGSDRSFDGVGAGLAALGMSCIVYGLARASAWGLVQPRDVPVVAGTRIEPFGMSPTITLVLVGALVLGCFGWWELRRTRLAAGTPIVDLSLFADRALRSSFLVVACQYAMLSGAMFAIAVYLQLALGLGAFDAGLRLVPLSLAVLVAGVASSRLSATQPPRRIVRGGTLLVFAGTLVVLGSLEVDATGLGFGLGMALMGAGIGAVVSQLGNTIQTMAGAERGSMAGAVQGASMNLGQSLGTAMLGAIVLTGLSVGVQQRVQATETLPPAVVARVEQASQTGIPTVPVDTVQAQLEDAGLGDDDVAELTGVYGNALVASIRAALAGVPFVALLAFFVAGGLPAKQLREH